jgi:diguanylate cyclase (GGDEF)-like protein/PAS domain S-box-containing protein/putative nucleotidyltransferase with HDIG domain
MPDKDCELIIENFPIGFIYLKGEFDDNGQLKDFSVKKVNLEFEHLFKLDRKDLLNKGIIEISSIVSFFQKKYLPVLINLSQSNEKHVYNKFDKKLNKWLKISLYSPRKYDLAIFFSDITKSIQPFTDTNVLFNIATDLITISDLNGLYLQVNEIWSTFYGYRIDEVEKHYAWEFVPAEEYSTIKNLYVSLTNLDASISHTHRLRHKNGNYSFIEWSYKRQGDRIYSVGRDVTERLNREKEIEYLSFHDVLTGLLNRRFLEEEMRRLNTARNLPISLIMCDVNRLKLINDAFGHEKGDELIKYAAQVFKESCRPEDLVARWGGDEFILFLPKTSYEDSKKIVERIKENSNKYSINSIQLSIACGICTKEDENFPIQDLLRNSEDAMYREKSKESERNRKDMISVIAQALYQKIPYEEEHAKRVSMLCHSLAVALKCSKEDIQTAEVAGLFHDIGKVAISSEILLKQSKLNESDWQIIRQHTEVGSKVVGVSSELKDIGKAILHHHERYDGKGYPSGMKWDEIPLISRIISLAEAFDSIYHKTDKNSKTSIKDTIHELRKNKQTQFDPFITEIFIKDVVEKQFSSKND